MSSSPSSSTNGLNSELESFRRKWISDLRHQTHDEQPAPQSQSRHDGPRLAPSTAGSGRRRRPSVSHSSASKPVHSVDENEDNYIQSQSFDEPASASQPAHDAHGVHGVSARKKLVSALDHYEEAMAKEAQGNMGDSLKLYRKAYRLDNGVDRRFREKHFPKAKPATHPSSSSALTNTAPVTTSTSSQAAPGVADEPQQPQSIGELIASFAGLKIEPCGPAIEGTPPPPSPLAELPEEILVHIMHDVAVLDVADFARLAHVCKRLAYLVSTEQRIWRRVALGSKVGFPAMLYRFERGIEWDDLPEEEREAPEIIDGFVVSPTELARRRRSESIALTESLTPSVYPSWQDLFRSRPRIRFNGCYISTVNYVRSGQASTNQTTWGSPILIVTYYRYLRFFRDGSLISLLTTNEPAAVVHHLTRDDLAAQRKAPHPHLPNAVMALALRGRWRLSSADDVADPDAPAPSVPRGPRRDDPEGDVFIETEGVGAKYIYRMDLSLRSAGKGARNNKLTWRGYYNYNKLTDDWGEFGLKNDKPFFFSRVKSYGSGE
ncbi:hypothetical protein B0J13DRAFT_234029 [Dactylonectria estremocensis]|uniref:F-box domain-containing protein n=1 Tax=Dactylonectria estremocensis TaxID=1079267 RepID=A0A9P9F8D3_9HYPO|nr:hypothetical protein B0J13DRAFT_234029 [Dactylonectria estremocensis]